MAAVAVSSDDNRDVIGLIVAVSRVVRKRIRVTCEKLLEFGLFPPSEF